MTMQKLQSLICAARITFVRCSAIAGFAAIASGTLGCGDSSVGPDVPAVTPVTRSATTLFQTDSLAYSLRLSGSWYSGEIGVTFTNRTSGAVYFVNCLGGTDVRLEKLVDGQWTGFWAPVLLDCLSPPITVAAGATYRMRIGIAAGVSGTNTAPQFASPDISGEYRAVWTEMLSSYQDRLPFGDPLPLTARVSNPFFLSAPAR